MSVDKVVMKEKIEATIDLLTQLLADFTEEAPVAEEKPAKATKGKKVAPVQEEVAEKPAKVSKGKKKPVEPEPEEEPASEEDEDALTLEDLQEMDLTELKELATAQELEMPKKVTKATLLKAFEEQFFSEEDEEEAPAEEPEEKPAPKKGGKKKVEPAPEPEQEEEEELTAEDINEMSLEELKGIVKEYELEIPAATLKNVKKLRAAIIEIIEAPEEDDDDDDDDDAPDSFEASSERLEAEGEIEKEIRQLLKNKKLTTAKMKKFLANYYEGNADCEDCSNCSTEELTACYIQTKQALVDDEGEVHEEAEAYTRNGEDYCCGVPLQEDNSCAICGSEYAEDEE